MLVGLVVVNRYVVGRSNSLPGVELIRLKMSNHLLNAEKIIDTVDLLTRRIESRFPGTGLLQVSNNLKEIAVQAKRRGEWIARPLTGLRISIWTFAFFIILAALLPLILLPISDRELTAVDFVSVMESAINDILLLGAAVFFLSTIETRVKRRRALAAIHELRAIAHIIDMHQLPKDPERILSASQFGPESELSPKLRMTAFQLQRYLDYCSEMLSLTGKVAALYVQNFDDGVALAAVNEVESLTTGLSRKIWQKIMILQSSSQLHDNSNDTQPKSND